MNRVNAGSHAVEKAGKAMVHARHGPGKARPYGGLIGFLASHSATSRSALALVADALVVGYTSHAAAPSPRPSGPSAAAVRRGSPGRSATGEWSDDLEDLEHFDTGGTQAPPVQAPPVRGRGMESLSTQEGASYADGRCPNPPRSNMAPRSCIPVRRVSLRLRRARRPRRDLIRPGVAISQRRRVARAHPRPGRHGGRARCETGIERDAHRRRPRRTVS
jgi:hypothetical protein